MLHFYFPLKGIKRHVSKTLAMKLKNRGLVSMIVRRAQQLATDSAATNRLKITLGRIRLGGYFLIEISSPFSLPEVSDRLLLSQPERAIFLTPDKTTLFLAALECHIEALPGTQDELGEIKNGIRPATRHDFLS